MSGTMSPSGLALRMTPVMGAAAASAAGGGVWLLLTDPVRIVRILEQKDVRTLAAMLVEVLTAAVRSVLAYV